MHSSLTFKFSRSCLHSSLPSRKVYEKKYVSVVISSDLIMRQISLLHDSNKLAMMEIQTHGFSLREGRSAVSPQFANRRPCHASPLADRFTFAHKVLRKRESNLSAEWPAWDGRRFTWSVSRWPLSLGHHAPAKMLKVSKYNFLHKLIDLKLQ